MVFLVMLEHPAMEWTRLRTAELVSDTCLPCPPCLGLPSTPPNTPVWEGAVPSVSSQQEVAKGLVSRGTLSSTCLCRVGSEGVQVQWEGGDLEGGTSLT